MPASKAGNAPSEFATTHWSLVVSAKGDPSRARSALAALCQAYWYPLYGYIRRQGLNAQDAEDLTQEFFARLLEKGWLETAARERGRFRSFLLTAMKHFLANEWDRARAAKRGGGQALLALDAMSAEARYRLEPAAPESAERFYDHRWALTLLDQVLTRLREEMAVAGKLQQFEALKFSLTGETCAYAEVARTLGLSEGAVKVAVHRLRERYRKLIRETIADTVANPDEIEDELRLLFAALS